MKTCLQAALMSLLAVPQCPQFATELVQRNDLWGLSRLRVTGWRSRRPGDGPLSLEHQKTLRDAGSAAKCQSPTFAIHPYDDNSEKRTRW